MKLIPKVYTSNIKVIIKGGMMQRGRGHIWTIIVLFLGVTCLFCLSQNLRGKNDAAGKDGKERRRGRRRNRDRPLDIDGADNGGKLFNALTINYPLSIFDPVNPNDWRTPAVYSKELEQVSTDEKHYIDIARAQDQEDVWLYENWFYGMKHGVIVESGALDGILFSTSFMFEIFANWTAVHVGKLQCFLLY